MNRTLCRMGLLAGVILLGLGPGTGLAQSFPRQLGEIKVFSSQDLEVVQFEFSQPYDGTPGEDHQPGTLALNFIGIGSNPPDRSFQIRESRVIQRIRVAQGRYSTTVKFTLRDDKATLKNQLEFSRRSNVLRMAIRPAGAAPQPERSGTSSDKALLEQMERVIAGQEPQVTEQQIESGDKNTAVATAPLSKFQAMEWVPAILTMIVALLVICAVLYGVVIIYNRFIGKRLGRFSGAHNIRVVASHHIGPKQRIVVVDIDGKLYACGVTATQISFLTRLSEDSNLDQETPPELAVAGPASPQPDAGGGGGGGINPAGDVAAPSGQAHAAQQFADVLKKKVRSLKQIK